MESNAAYDRASNWLGSRTAAAVIFIWAFAEAIIWPFIPDFVLLPFVVLRPKRWRFFVFLTIIGSAAGMSIHFLAVTLSPDLWRGIVLAVPFIEEDMFAVISNALRENMLFALLWQPYSGIAGKAWTYVAATTNVAVMPYLIGITLSRTLRMGVTGILGALAGTHLRVLIKKHMGAFLVLYVFAFATFLITYY